MDEETASKEPLLAGPSGTTVTPSHGFTIPIIRIENESSTSKSADSVHKRKPKPKPRFSMPSSQTRSTNSGRATLLGSSLDDEQNAELDELNAMIYAELPSTHKRRTILTTKPPEYRWISRRKTLLTFLGQESVPEPAPREGARSSAEETKVISELAEAITKADEFFFGYRDSSEPEALRVSLATRLRRQNSMSFRRESFLERNQSQRMSKRRYSNRDSKPSSADLDETDSMLVQEKVSHKYRDSLWNLDEEAIKLTSNQVSRKLTWVNRYLSDTLDSLNFMSQQLKEIEGHFGIATTSFFRFMRWLVKINFLVFFLFLCFIYIPQLTYENIFDDPPPSTVNTSAGFYGKTVRCSKEYSEYIDQVIDEGNDLDAFLDIAKGTGILEDTMLFYGYYSNLSFWLEDSDNEKIFGTDYNMGLAYLLTVGFSFVVLFFMIVKNSSKTIKETVLDFEKNAFPKYSNAVFGGWDYCINNTKSAFFKQKIIHNEFKAELEEMKLKRQLAIRTAAQKSKLVVKRIFMNIIVLAILGGAFYAIVWTGNFLLTKQSEDMGAFLTLLIQYLPSIVISVLNIFVPEIFIIIAEVEEYSHSFRTALTIVRCVFLRLSLVGVLIVSLYYKLQYEDTGVVLDCPEDFNKTDCCGNALWEPVTANDTKNDVKCWETYVGQQFYKLALADFLAVVLLSLLFKIPRRFAYDRLKDRFWIVSAIGKAKFDLPLEVLDIIYAQTLCWIGMFFTPLLPLITFVKMFIFFFLKKVDLLYACEPPRNAYRASRSYSFFQTVLLATFVLIAAIWAYMIGNIHPSMSCGPFRLYAYDDYVMFNAVTTEVDTWPTVPRRIVRYFGTAAFHIPAFFLLCLAIYYYWTIAQGYKKMEELLKEQLRSEAYDKQYLLARVDEVIKKGELVKDEEPFI